MLKIKNLLYLRNGSRESDFDEIFDPQGICRVYWQVFRKNHFPAIFDPQVICRVYRQLFPKIIFPFLAAILDLCIKPQNAFILEMVQDRAILTTFLTPRLCGESTGEVITYSKLLKLCCFALLRIHIK